MCVAGVLVHVALAVDCDTESDDGFERFEITVDEHGCAFVGAPDLDLAAHLLVDGVAVVDDIRSCRTAARY